MNAFYSFSFDFLFRLVQIADLPYGLGVSALYDCTPCEEHPSLFRTEQKINQTINNI